MKYIMMSKGNSDVLAIFNDKQQAIKAGSIAVETAEAILKIGTAKAQEEIFFVPTKTGKMPISCKKSKTLSLQEFKMLKPSPKERKARVVTVEQNNKVEQLLRNKVSVNRTVELTGVSRSSVKRIKKTLSLSKTYFKPTGSKGFRGSEPTNSYHSTSWWVHDADCGQKKDRFVPLY